MNGQTSYSTIIRICILFRRMCADNHRKTKVNQLMEMKLNRMI